jgi:hypothetical protein
MRAAHNLGRSSRERENATLTNILVLSHRHDPLVGE